MEYDENFLLKAADRFEQQARAIVSSTAARFGLFALIGSYIFAFGLDFIVRHNMAAAADGRPLDIPQGAIVLIATAAAVGIGIMVGRARAFLLRVEAHKLLALIEIHRSTQKQFSFFNTPPEIAQEPHA